MTCLSRVHGALLGTELIGLPVLRAAEASSLYKQGRPAPSMAPKPAANGASRRARVTPFSRAGGPRRCDPATPPTRSGRVVVALVGSAIVDLHSTTVVEQRGASSWRGARRS